MRLRTLGVIAAAGALVAGFLPTAAQAADDPRVGLGAGWLDAQSATSGLELTKHNDKPAGFVNPDSPGSSAFANSDLAFSGNYAFAGNYNGFNIYDLSTGADPVLKTSVVCPGGQGDLSVYGNLLFMSVEETRGRIDCGTQGAPGTVNPERFRGVRIFDISDINAPTQVAAVQACRGSHTHTIVTSPKDKKNVYVYVQGTSSVRSGDELAGCANTARDRPEHVAVAYRGHQGSAEEPRAGRDRRPSPACSPTWRRARSTVCRTPRRRRSTRRARTGRPAP